MYKDDEARWYKASGLECWVTPELDLRKPPTVDEVFNFLLYEIGNKNK